MLSSQHLEGEAELGTEGQPQLLSEFEASLGYMRLSNLPSCPSEKPRGDALSPSECLCKLQVVPTDCVVASLLVSTVG